MKAKSKRENMRKLRVRDWIEKCKPTLIPHVGVELFYEGYMINHSGDGFLTVTAPSAKKYYFLIPFDARKMIDDKIAERNSRRRLIARKVSA